MSRIRKTLLAVLLGRGLMAVRQLLMVPILLKAWGVDYYGNWLVLSAIPSFLAMSNLGLGSSAAAKIAIRPPDRERENSETLTTAVGTILAVMLIVLIGVVAWGHWLGDGAFSLEHGVAIFLLLVTSSFLRMVSQPLQGWWNAQGKAHLGIHSSQAFNVGELIIYASVPLLGGKALILTSISCGWTILWLVGYGLFARREGCRLFRPTAFRRREIPDLLLVGVGHQLSPLWQGLLFQGSILLAKALFGPAGAALWGSLRVVNRAGNQILELVSQTCGPEFQRNHAAGNIEGNRRLHARGVLISLSIATGMALGLIGFGPMIFRWWTHGEFREPYLVWIVLPLSLIPFSLWWISGEYQRSMNMPWYLNSVGCLAAIGSLVLSWVLGSFTDMGLLSMCFGALFFEAIMAASVSFRSIRLLGLRVPSFIRDLTDEGRNLVRLLSGLNGQKRTE